MKQPNVVSVIGPSSKEVNLQRAVGTLHTGKIG